MSSEKDAQKQMLERLKKARDKQFPPQGKPGGLQSQQQS